MFPMMFIWDSTCFYMFSLLGVVLISRVDVTPGNFPTAGSIARLDLTRGLEAMQLVLGAREVLRPAGDTGG